MKDKKEKKSKQAKKVPATVTTPEVKELSDQDLQRVTGGWGGPTMIKADENIKKDA